MTIIQEAITAVKTDDKGKFRLKAALGALRRFDERIGKTLDLDRWDLPIDSSGELPDVLTQAERRAKLTKRETKTLVIDPDAR